MKRAFIASEVFFERTLHTGLAVLTLDGVITEIVPCTTVPNEYELIRIDGILAPGFVDIQVNGCNGALLNRDQDEACIRTMHAGSIRHGVLAVYPTLITCTDAEILHVCTLMEHVLRDKTLPAIQGLHLEGPYIGTTNNGTHSLALIRPLDDRMLQCICEYGEKRVLRIITVAAEQVVPQQITRMADAGIVVSLGHSNAPPSQLKEAVDAGASLITHLYNGMPPLSGRAPSLVGYTYTDPRLCASIIPDMVHVDGTAIHAALCAMQDRLFAVTDSTFTYKGTDTSTPIMFEVNGETYTVIDGVIRNTGSGSLAGSTATMDSVCTHLAHLFGLERALLMCSVLPANAMALRTGSIQKGYNADFVVLAYDDAVVTVQSAYIHAMLQDVPSPHDSSS